MDKPCTTCGGLRPAAAFQKVLQSGEIKTLKTCSTCRDRQARERQAQKRVASAALSEFNDRRVRRRVDIANKTRLCPECHSLLSATENCFTCFSPSPSPSSSQAETAQPVQQRAALTALTESDLNVRAARVDNANQQACAPPTRQIRPAQPAQQRVILTSLTESSGDNSVSEQCCVRCNCIRPVAAFWSGSYSFETCLQCREHPATVICFCFCPVFNLYFDSCSC